MKTIGVVKNELNKGAKLINIDYNCHTTRTNDEYIVISICGEEVATANGMSPKQYLGAINAIIDVLKPEFPNLHLIRKNREFHFSYPGFNSCCTENVPVAISNEDESKEVKKTGKVSERYTMCGASKVMEVINAHPDYELYKRSGFSFRGAGEGRTDLEGIKRLCNWACCLDVEVIDNEIHVNGFSASDMW